MLKITEYNEYQIETFDQMKDIFINELIATESLALMKDDYNSIDSMLFENSNLTSVAESLQITNILSATSSVNNFNNAEFDQSIKDYIFSPDSEIGTLMSLMKSTLLARRWSKMVSKIRPGLPKMACPMLSLAVEPLCKTRSTLLIQGLLLIQTW